VDSVGWFVPKLGISKLPYLFSIIIFEFAGKMKDEDKVNIVEFLLQNYYIKENEALQEQVNYLQVLLFDKNRELETMADILSEANRRIASMQSDVVYYQRVIAAQRRNERILIDRQGNHHMFRRNRNGAFVPVENVSDSSTDTEVNRQLDLENIDDSDSDSDDIMTLLMDA
jgi:hypothetical protein